MTARYRVHDCTHDHLPNAPATRKVASNAGTWTWWAPELLRLHPDRKADATGQSSVPTPPPGARRLAEQVAASDGLRCRPRGWPPGCLTHGRDKNRPFALTGHQHA